MKFDFDSFRGYSTIVCIIIVGLCAIPSTPGHTQVTKTVNNTTATTTTTPNSFVLIAPNGLTYKLVKMFDKPSFAANETIVSYQVDAQGNIVGVETNLSVYKLVAQ